MSKRISVATNSAVDAIDALNDADLAAMEQKAANLRMIPLPTVETNIPWELVFSDRDFNVRDNGEDGSVSSYSYEENKELHKSLKEDGLKMMGGDNLSFSLQSDGRYKLISGNLRYAMMSLIRNDAIKLALESGQGTPDTSKLPFAVLFGLVFKGLTIEQETDLMADHLLKKGLNEFEKCKEIGEFIHRTGITDARAGVKFGMDKNKIARYRMRYAMPTCMKEYRKEKGKDKTVSFVKVKQGQLKELYTAYLTDQSGGYGYRQEGPHFHAAWKIILDNPDAFVAVTKKADTQERNTILNHAKSVKATFGNSPEMDFAADILAWSANETRDGKPVNLLNALSGLAEQGKALRAEIESLRATVETLTVERNDALAAIASLTTDYNGTIAERDELRAENEALKAKKPNGKASK